MRLGNLGLDSADGDDFELEDEVQVALARAAGGERAARLQNRLADAGRNFRSERYTEAARLLRRLVQEVPQVAEVRELYGLTLYRLERWRDAARELEAFRVLTNSTEQHPVLADCYRALRQWDRVEALWDELRATSPSAGLVTEGRIVMAGARADQGNLRGAIKLLEQRWRLPKRPTEHHLRRAYALADLYERAGHLVRARELFDWIARMDPSFVDARRRAKALT
ncbi:MAG: hypothetical protein N2037_12045 [Acidimicrobiales bacterium]|nr:hypothetical protein [Acidimicrobiales bacterium]